jgi:hypothetical protein
VHDDSQPGLPRHGCRAALSGKAWYDIVDMITEGDIDVLQILLVIWYQGSPSPSLVSRSSPPGKGLARYRAQGSARLQPLPIRTAREVFPQAAHPVSFVERVMGRLAHEGHFHENCSALGSGWVFPVQTKHVMQVLITPSPSSDVPTSPFDISVALAPAN